MNGPHTKCSLCDTFLCIVATVTPQFCITQCLECFPPKECIPDNLDRIPLSGPAAAARPLYHILEISHGSEETCGYSWDPFSLECQVCTFHATEFRPQAGSFLTPKQLHLSIFFTVVSSLLASNRQFQQFPVWFGCRIVKTFHAMDRYGNSWQILLLHSCPNCVFISFPCGLAVSFKVDVPFELPFCQCFMIIW